MSICAHKSTPEMQMFIQNANAHKTNSNKSTKFFNCLTPVHVSQDKILYLHKLFFLFMNFTAVTTYGRF